MSKLVVLNFKSPPDTCEEVTEVAIEFLNRLYQNLGDSLSESLVDVRKGYITACVTEMEKAVTKGGTGAERSLALLESFLDERCVRYTIQ